MNNHDYLWPGIAAATVATLYPLYWIYYVADLSLSLDSYGSNLSFDFSDWVFLIIGVLLVYLYTSLKRILHDHHNFRAIDTLLIIMIITTGVFYLGSFVTEVLIASVSEQSSQDILVSVSLLLGFGSNVIFGIVDILIAIVLLRASRQLPDLLRNFAMVTLVAGICELTIFLSFASIFLFPISAIMLAVYFLRKPEIIEVV